MTGKFKKVISMILIVAFAACLMLPFSVSAAGPTYFFEYYVESGGYVIHEKYMYEAGEIVYIRAIPNEGFAFFRWMSDDVAFENPASDYTRFVMPAKDVKVTAVFALAQDAAQSVVNVTFDTMGGTAFEGYDVAVGEPIPEPATNPAKEGYIFDGWYSDAICTLPYDFSTPVYSPTILYAKWAKVMEEQVANAFSDVKEGDWFYSYVKSLAEKNIISGMGKTSSGEAYFAPQANITRAQFVKILLNMAGENIYKDVSVSELFDDVKNDAWYAEAVAWAYSTGVASGVGNKKFNPDSNITRQDMAVMISNYTTKVAKKTLPDKVERVEFADHNKISQYALSSVETMQRAGIISGKSNNHGSVYFDPRAYATRAETSKMIDILISLF